jgi:hypothetical protein
MDEKRTVVNEAFKHQVGGIGKEMLEAEEAVRKVEELEQREKKMTQELKLRIVELERKERENEKTIRELKLRNDELEQMFRKQKKLMAENLLRELEIRTTELEKLNV